MSNDACLRMHHLGSRIAPVARSSNNASPGNNHKYFVDPFHCIFIAYILPSKSIGHIDINPLLFAQQTYWELPCAASSIYRRSTEDASSSRIVAPGRRIVVERIIAPDPERRIDVARIVARDTPSKLDRERIVAADRRANRRERSIVSSKTNFVKVFIFLFKQAITLQQKHTR